MQVDDWKASENTISPTNSSETIVFVNLLAEIDT